MIKGVELRPAQEFFFQISSLVLIVSGSFFVNKRICADKINFALASLPLWFILVFLKYMSGWSITLNIFIGFMVYLTAIRTLTNSDIRFLLKGIGYLASVSVAYLALQKWGFDLRGLTLRNQGNVAPAVSIFGLEAVMGIFYAVAIPVILSFSWVSLLLFIPLVFSWSSAAYISAGAAVMIYYWFKKRVVFWYSLIPIVCAIFYFVVFIDAPMGMFNTRIPMWGMVIQDTHNHPVIGSGLDSFRDPINKDSYVYFKNSFNDVTVRAVKRGDGGYDILEKPSARALELIEEKKNPVDFWDNAHNVYIHYSYEAGFPFLVIVGFILYFIYRRFILSKRSKETVALFASIIVFFMTAMTQFPFNLARIGYLFPILLGLFYVSSDDTQQVMV